MTLLPYNPSWPELFESEKNHLREVLPQDLIGRIEHFGSTAVPGLSAKPIIDMLVEVTDLEEVKTRVVPVLEAEGYDYVWRPTWGDDVPPWYAWFIKRDADGIRTHHIHVVEPHFEHWDRLIFCDYLIEHPAVAREYKELKLRLIKTYGHDRLAYTKGKTDFVVWTTAAAKKYYARTLKSGTAK